MDVLGPQHVKVIKPPHLNVSSSLYNYASPKEKEKKKKRFEIWAEGCGAIWQNKQNYPNTSKTSRVRFSLCSVTIC